MYIQCEACGYAGEAVWRGGKCMCAMCGTEIENAAPQANQAAQQSAPIQNAQYQAVPPQAAQPTMIKAVCPVCKNDNNNHLINGQCRCSMCGTMFDFNQQYNASYNNNYANNYGGNNYNPYQNYELRRLLEKERNRKLGWAIFWLIFCWPISIYYFYKYNQIGKQISRL